MEEFARQGFDVRVVCLEEGTHAGNFPVHSLGKEARVGTLGRLVRFLKYAFTLEYDRVFVHMNPVYFTLAGWYWRIRGIPSYLWFTHYTTNVHLRCAAACARRLFAATRQSLPQYEDDPKKVVTGHGIDMRHWLHHDVDAADRDSPALLAVHRLSRSKRVEIAIRALALLPERYTLTIYGRPVDEAYYGELLALVEDLDVANRIEFRGPVPMDRLKHVYHRFPLMINMASETIDKTMLEACLFGTYPATTPGNAQAIGLDAHPADETPESLASFILEGSWKGYGRERLRRVVQEGHSLAALVEELSGYIRPGR